MISCIEYFGRYRPMQMSEKNLRRRKGKNRVSPKSTFVQVAVSLPPAERCVYPSAVRLLKRIMGSQAPTSHAVMQAQICGRSVSDIVDGHLDSVDWPHQEAEPKAGMS